MWRYARLPVYVLGAWVLMASDPISVDVRFDQTGDGLVDAADWSGMDDAARMAYARASLQALGQDPDVLLPGGMTRAQKYLQGLRAVYE